MNLKWDIKEIKLRIKEVTKQLQEESLDDNYLKLYDELLDLCSMMYFVNGSLVDDNFLSKNQQKFILKHYQEQALEGIKIFENNILIHTSSSKKVIENFNKVHFHSYDGDLEKVSIRENIELVRDFLQQYDLEQLDYFDYLIKNNCINISDRKLKFYQGISFLSLKKSYILCNNFGNINLAVTLIHEYGHTYSSFKNNYQHLNKNLNLSEINSHYMEYMFLDFLIKNNLFGDDALLIQNRNYKDLYVRSLMLLILTSIDNLKCEESYIIINEDAEIKKSILKLQDVRYSELLSLTADTLNLHDILNYTYGNLMGLMYFAKYSDNPSKIKKELEYVIKGKKTLRDIVTLDGLDKQLVLNNMRMN